MAPHRFSNDEYEEAFERDGLLRDVCVEPVALVDWHSFLRWIAEQYPYKFCVEGEPATFPDVPEALFRTYSIAPPSLAVDVSGMALNCHFFDQDEIELDLDPRQVVDDAAVGSILAFMVGLGALLGKEVQLTPESTRGCPFYRYDPSSGQVVYVPPNR